MAFSRVAASPKEARVIPVEKVWISIYRSDEVIVADDGDTHPLLSRSGLVETQGHRGGSDVGEDIWLSGMAIGLWCVFV